MSNIRGRQSLFENWWNFLFPFLDVKGLFVLEESTFQKEPISKTAESLTRKPRVSCFLKPFSIVPVFMF